MSSGPSPLLGYNTNVRHKGKLYHIQTEDSGVNHPHIITHLFADGGRIIGSRKTDYRQHLGAGNLSEIVKKLMQEQHKAMFIALRDCEYDEDEGGKAASAEAPAAAELAAEAAPAAAASVHPREATPLPAPAALPELDFDALDRAAEAHIAQSVAAKSKKKGRGRVSAGRYSQTVAANKRGRSSMPPAPERTSIFDERVVRSKSLDEVILSYLADDPADEKSRT
jgi:hypothetical protein